MNIFHFPWGKKSADFEQIMHDELRRTKKIRQSLLDYDEGKKDISTANVERRLSDLRNTSPKR